MVIKLISEGKANFDGCKGPFTIGDDLSAIADIKKIDLSSLGGRLQGSFESLGALVNLRSISVSGCKKLDCSRALELLASWDWAMQLESLNIGATNAEGQLKYCWSRPPMQIY